ncbi:MAG: ATP-grasp domain-containing protein [Bdellovibrionota bacterium]
MRIALVTCEAKPEGSSDDRILQSALLTRGHEAHWEIWSNAGADWGTYDLALIRSPWDYYKRLPDFLAWTEKVGRLTRLANPKETIRENATKDYLLDLEMRGLPIVPSIIAQDKATAMHVAVQMLEKGPLIVKPTVSGSSYLTFLLKDEALLESSVQKVLAHSEVLLQPFIESIATDGEISLIYFRIGKEWKYSHAVLKTAAPNEFRVQSDYSGKVESFEPSKKIFAFAQAILERLSPHDSYVRIDLVDWKTKPKIGEIELIEPALFFGFSPGAAARQIEALEMLPSI